MDEARIEAVAKALCRAARLDPDAPGSSRDQAPYYSSLAPLVEGKPAWHRFRPVARNFCEARDYLSFDAPTPKGLT